MGIMGGGGYIGIRLPMCPSVLPIIVIIIITIIIIIVIIVHCRHCGVLLGRGKSLRRGEIGLLGYLLHSRHHLHGISTTHGRCV